MASADGGERLLANNRKAFYSYTIQEKIEVGIALKGTEVKSMKVGQFAFTDSYARVSRSRELILVGLHISPYPFGNLFNHNPDRERVLLAHRDEIRKLARKVDERGCTLVPLKFYLCKGRVKLLLGIAQGKKMQDKRESIRKRDEKRMADRELKHNQTLR